MSIATRRTGASRPLLKAVSALTVTQIVGWGTTFHIPAVLSGRIAAGTGLSQASVFAGLTIMLIVSAALSPSVGRVLSRDGAGPWMAAGSGLVGTGLVVMSLSNGLGSFVLAWIVLGAAMPLALNQGASTAIVQVAPDRARRAIAMLLILTGLSSTIAWPVLLYLDGHLGWRTTLLAGAGLNLLVCAPLHYFGLPHGRTKSGARRSGPAGPEPVHPAPPGTFPLAALGFSLAGVLTWGLPLHMIEILKDLGHTENTAVSIGALLGPGQVLARLFEMAGGRKIGIMAIGVGSAALMPLALLALLLWGTTPAGAVAFTVGYGLSAGLISIVRAVAPLRLFGAAAYATMLGRLGLPQNIAFASAPLGFALLREHFGVRVLLEVSLGIGIVCVAAMVLLARRAPPVAEPAVTTAPGA